MIHVGFTEFRKRMAHFLDRAVDDCDIVLITRQGSEPAVIMPLSEYERMKETLYLRASPENADRLTAAVKRLDNGMGKERDLIEP